MKWGRIGRMDFPEAYVRRMLANTLVSGRRRAWIGEWPTEDLPERAGDSSDIPVLDRAVLWPLVVRSPRASGP